MSKARKSIAKRARGTGTMRSATENAGREMTTRPVVTPPPVVDASAEVKPKTPFESAAKVVRSVQLAAVQFRAFSAQALDASQTIPEDTMFAFSTKFLRPTVTPTEEGFSSKTTLLFQVGGKRPNQESAPEPYAVIRATLEARYGLKPDSPEFTEDDLMDYALCYCPFHVWGYWREFVQSSLARLDLPQFTIPLFLIHQAPEMVRDRLD